MDLYKGGKALSMSIFSITRLKPKTLLKLLFDLQKKQQIPTIHNQITANWKQNKFLTKKKQNKFFDHYKMIIMQEESCYGN